MRSGLILAGALVATAAYAQTTGTPASDESLAVIRDMVMYSVWCFALYMGYRQGRGGA